MGEIFIAFKCPQIVENTATETIFVIKIRFPPGKSLGTIENSLNNARPAYFLFTNNLVKSPKQSISEKGNK